jgi:hypothetical protein
MAISEQLFQPYRRDSRCATLKCVLRAREKDRHVNNKGFSQNNDKKTDEMQNASRGS